MPTIRQQMIDLLGRETLGAKDLSQMLGIREKEVYPHLGHIARSVAARKAKLDVVPPRCLSCGFTFDSRKRYTRPGRCPQCRGQRIEEPRYRIR